MHPRLITLSILGSLAIPFFAHAAFRDVPPRHANLDAINYVQAEGIVTGYADGTFKPDQSINRAEFTKIVMAASQYGSEIGRCNETALDYFADVPRSTWYSQHACVGYARGILQGNIVANGKPQFRPSENINVIAAAKILTVAFGIGDPPMDCSGPAGGARCMEAAERGDIWYKRHVLALEERNAIPLSLTSFQQDVTRGEMAEMIYRLRAGITTKPSRSYIQLENPSKPSVAPLSEWPTYKNEVVGYSMQYSPERGGMSSDTFAIWEGACAVGGHVGPIAISVLTKTDVRTDPYLEDYREQMLLSAQERAAIIWQKNVAEASRFPGKQTGKVETIWINGKKAYRLWTTESIDTITGGRLIDEKHFIILYDIGETMFEFTYAASDEGVVNEMFSTWREIPVRYVGKTLYEGAQKCQKTFQ